MPINYLLISLLQFPSFLFFFFFSLSVNYTLVETNQQQGHTRRCLLFSRQEQESIVFASVDLPNRGGGGGIKAVGL